jgi:hypothetical protein
MRMRLEGASRFTTITLHVVVDLPCGALQARECVLS